MYLLEITEILVFFLIIPFFPGFFTHYDFRPLSGEFAGVSRAFPGPRPLVFSSLSYLSLSEVSIADITAHVNGLAQRSLD